ncbi:MAG TPA: AraC family transcriptional regulator [Candidatus Acutalibacter pullicola]|uniref:AraC family transcriptional regulator n=1 Tax=Candidatus Acutalibacter pullicola TaxID=2838417 RepID=A0A9D2SG00_9FIRM|nr:AraC family transcriptional regulator [Candidatus Acutalibacter pullicola]
MQEELMRRLRQVTEEEERLLAGGQVDKSLYSSGAGFLIDSEKLLAKGKLITVRPHTRFASFPMHRHNYVEIMYMCSGKTVHRMEGRPPLTLQAGELLFLNQNAAHGVDRAGEEDVGVNFIVLPQFFDYALALIGMDNVLGKFLLSGLRQSGGELSCLHFRVSHVPTVQNLVENLVWSLVHPQPNARRINQATMGVLLLQLLNYTEDLEEASGNGAVLSALREIEENYRTADLTRLAGELHVSLPYLSAAVHRATGRTFKELLLEKRLSKAAQLLRETRLTTQDIILAVGYENTSYFYRVFRARFGITPKEYRRQQGGNFLPQAQ